jgi:hypothetical protein
MHYAYQHIRAPPKLTPWDDACSSSTKRAAIPIHQVPLAEGDEDSRHTPQSTIFRRSTITISYHRISQREQSDVGCAVQLWKFRLSMYCTPTRRSTMFSHTSVTRHCLFKTQQRSHNGCTVQICMPQRFMQPCASKQTDHMALLPTTNKRVGCANMALSTRGLRAQHQCPQSYTSQPTQQHWLTAQRTAGVPQRNHNESALSQCNGCIHPVTCNKSKRFKAQTPPSRICHQYRPCSFGASCLGQLKPRAKTGHASREHQKCGMHDWHAIQCGMSRTRKKGHH